MADYKKMYFTMLRASEQARKHFEAAEQIIIRVQQQCEELYMEEDAPILTFVVKSKE